MKDFIALLIIGSAIAMVLSPMIGRAIDVEFQMQDEITNHYIRTAK